MIKIKVYNIFSAYGEYEDQIVINAYIKSSLNEEEFKEVINEISKKDCFKKWECYEKIQFYKSKLSKRGDCHLLETEPVYIE